MIREEISEHVKRRLYAESMGRCMNPNCREELFTLNGDIIEKAHIIPYCDTADNSFENLLVLCPNCHTKFDKNNFFNADEVKNWKQIRKSELDRIFSKKYTTFDEMSVVVVPLLLENKTIYENYYLDDKKELWNKFEGKILANNKLLSKILKQNRDLIQTHREKKYSNLEFVDSFLAHIDEFEATRTDEEKSRHILFPIEINSMFGISPIKGDMLPSTESLEVLIEELSRRGKFKNIVIGNDNPYIVLIQDSKFVNIFLNDAPKMRQLYFDYDCFRKSKVRLDSLNFALKYINSKKIIYKFSNFSNLREILINNIRIIFIYEYCLSKVDLIQLLPEANCVIVNLHNWNGKSCISKEAYDFSNEIGVTLLTMDDFYVYINGLK